MNRRALDAANRSRPLLRPGNAAISLPPSGSSAPTAARVLRGTLRATPTADGALTRSPTAEVRFDRAVVGDPPSKRETAAIRGGSEISEDYQIVSRARGEPLPEGCTGVRVRLQLSGYPSPRWSRDLAARLSRELVGHVAVGHLRLNVNDIVHGTRSSSKASSSEAPALGDALEKAIDAANRASTGAPKPPPNMTRKDADGIARTIDVHEP